MRSIVTFDVTNGHQSEQ